MIKEIYENLSKEKISRFRNNADISMMATPDLYIGIKQDPKTGLMTVTKGEFDNDPTVRVHKLGYTEVAKNVDRQTVFHLVEKMGVSADTVVDRIEDLEDFREPAVMHKQTYKEKEVILSKVGDMKPGDEFSYTLPDQYGGYDNSVITKGETFKLACIEHNVLQYVQEDRYNPEMTEAEKVPIAYRVKTWDMAKDTWENGALKKIQLAHRPDGVSLNEPVRFDMSEISDVKIIPKRYTEQEIQDIASGKSINYDKVCERQPIENKEKYMDYVLQKNRPDYSYGDSIPMASIQQEWDSVVQRVPTWKKPGYMQEHTGNGIRFVEDPDTLPKKAEVEHREQYEKDHMVSSTEEYVEKNAIEKQVRNVQKCVEEAENVELIDTVSNLRWAAKDFDRQGKEWRKVAENCREAADQLTLGKNLDVVTSQEKEPNEHMKHIAKKLHEMYPNMEKGIKEYQAEQVDQLMKDFQKQQGELLKYQISKRQKEATQSANISKSHGGDFSR